MKPTEAPKVSDEERAKLRGVPKDITVRKHHCDETGLDWLVLHDEARGVHVEIPAETLQLEAIQIGLRVLAARQPKPHHLL